MKKLSFILALFILVSCELAKPTSPVSFPKLISDGMVLQRDQPVVLWGKGIPNEKIRATLAGAIGSTKVLEDSTWKVQLPPVPAGGPYVLEVNSQRVEDVWVGDVWVAGGQSNMEWPLKSGVIDAEDEFSAAEFPPIHFFKVGRDYSAVERDDVSDGMWKVANPENLPDFSAVAWFFAKRNHEDYQVPVGIIESNWGGTPAEGWTEATVLASLGDDRSYAEEVQDVVQNAAKWNEVVLENEKRKEIRDLMVRRPDSLLAVEVSGLTYSDGEWKTIRLPEENPMTDIAWLRKDFTLESTQGVNLHLPDINQMAFIYLNGVQVHYKDWGAAMPELELPDAILQKGKNVLTARVINTWNNRPELGKKGEMYLLQNGKKINLEGAWKYSNDLVEPKLPEVGFYNWKPGFMFNAMIAPITNYPIKGAIWYQGESNAGRPGEYQELFSAMIQNWRARWGIGDFPFLFVQLANFMERKEIQPESNWAALREAQKNTLSLDQTGMAVIIDIGEAGDIHPRNKKDVGDRLWLQARKVAFGEDGISSGPIFNSVTQSGNQLILKFSEVGLGLKLISGEEVKGFVIEDSKGKFEVAKGVVSGNDSVTLSLSEGVEPVRVLYAWADNPEVNLVNELNLPAVPFRIDL